MRLATALAAIICWLATTAGAQLPGDADCSQLANPLDLAAVEAAIFECDACADDDANCDGVVTAADLVRILRDPPTAISCDCGAIPIDTGHPRNWGAYPRLLGHNVREPRLVDLPERADCHAGTGRPHGLGGQVLDRLAANRRPVAPAWVGKPEALEKE